MCLEARVVRVVRVVRVLRELRVVRRQRGVQLPAALRRAARQVARHALAGPGLRVEGAQPLLLRAARAAAAHALQHTYGLHYQAEAVY